MSTISFLVGEEAGDRTVAVEARNKEQAIVQDLQERKTVADCGRNTDDVQHC